MTGIRPTLAALALLAATLAGCSTGTDGPGDDAGDRRAQDAALYDAIEQAIGTPVANDHDHGDPALHASSHNLDLVTRITGAPGRTPPAGESFVETAVWDGYAYVCRTGPEEGLVIVDVRDPENPAFLSDIRLDAGFEADVEISADGNYAFWETQRIPGQGIPDVTDPTSVPGVAPYGIHVVDISDKANPRWVSFTPVAPNGPHAITYASIGGRDIVFASTYAWNYVGGPLGQPRLAPTGMQREVILELDRSLPVPTLVQIAEYQDPDATEDPLQPEGGKMPHDVSVAVHPVTNKTYAYVAYWDLGIVILDVSDPANPTKVGVANDFGPAPYNAIHMARQSEALIDGKVILVAEPEIGGQEDSGYMTFIDGTDPTAPTYLSSWRIPGNLSTEGGLGPHYFDFQRGRVVMASYHAGFWVIDVHDAANLARPRTVAFAQTNVTGIGADLPGPLGAFGGSGTAFDAWWLDATHVVAGDIFGGLAVYRYTGPAPAIDQPASP